MKKSISSSKRPASANKNILKNRRKPATLITRFNNLRRRRPQATLLAGAFILVFASAGVTATLLSRATPVEIIKSVTVNGSSNPITVREGAKIKIAWQTDPIAGVCFSHSNGMILWSGGLPINGSQVIQIPKPPTNEVYKTSVLITCIPDGNTPTGNWQGGVGVDVYPAGWPEVAATDNVPAPPGPVYKQQPSTGLRPNNVTMRINGKSSKDLNSGQLYIPAHTDITISWDTLDLNGARVDQCYGAGRNFVGSKPSADASQRVNVGSNVAIGYPETEAAKNSYYDNRAYAIICRQTNTDGTVQEGQHSSVAVQVNPNPGAGPPASLSSTPVLANPGAATPPPQPTSSSPSPTASRTPGSQPSSSATGVNPPSNASQSGTSLNADGSISTTSGTSPQDAKVSALESALYGSGESSPNADTPAPGVTKKRNIFQRAADWIRSIFS